MLAALLANPVTAGLPRRYKFPPSVDKIKQNDDEEVMMLIKAILPIIEDEP